MPDLVLSSVYILKYDPPISDIGLHLSYPDGQTNYEQVLNQTDGMLNFSRTIIFTEI